MLLLLPPEEAFLATFGEVLVGIVLLPLLAFTMADLMLLLFYPREALVPGTASSHEGGPGTTTSLSCCRQWPGRTYTKALFVSVGFLTGYQSNDQTGQRQRQQQVHVAVCVRSYLSAFSPCTYRRLCFGFLTQYTHTYTYVSHISLSSPSGNISSRVPPVSGLGTNTHTQNLSLPTFGFLLLTCPHRTRVVDLIRAVCVCVSFEIYLLSCSIFPLPPEKGESQEHTYGLRHTHTHSYKLSLYWRLSLYARACVCVCWPLSKSRARPILLLTHAVYGPCVCESERVCGLWRAVRKVYTHAWQRTFLQ